MRATTGRGATRADEARPTTPRTAAAEALVVRAERIELRATAQQKDLLAAAATYSHMDLTTFILRTVLPAAREIVEREEKILLSERDTRRVLELLENPPEPTPKLLAAAKLRPR
jgi:uncharacterized protein (DUF1778 family)